MEVCDTVGTAGGLYTKCNFCTGYNYYHRVGDSAHYVAVISSLDTEEVMNVMIYHQLEHHIVVVSLKIPFGTRDEGTKL